MKVSNTGAPESRTKKPVPVPNNLMEVPLGCADIIRKEVEEQDWKRALNGTKH